MNLKKLAPAVLSGVLVACAAAETPAPGLPATELPADLPSDYKQQIPRGRIASIDTPEFVSASEAEISEDAWVLGVVVDGEAHAYSLNLLNRHEIVNDKIGGKNFAAVW